MFLMAVKYSEFYKVMAQKIPCAVLTEDQFAKIFVDELENYVANTHIN